MTLQQLKYVVTVAETGNITGAAEKLFISQPSLTAAIQALEKEMGVTVFSRSSRGVVITAEGEELLAYARQVLEQAELMQERFCGRTGWNPRFSVSCQHYSFAVNAFVDVIRQFDSEQYDFTLRETQTHEIIEDVSFGRSEIGVIYLSSKNQEVLTKLFQKYDLVYDELYVASPHVFICREHPLAGREMITLEELEPYPYLSFEQGEHNSFYFSEEILSSLDRKKNIRVRDRATLFNLVIGLNGYTVSSGVIDAGLNGENIVARPLQMEEKIRIGVITRKNTVLSRYGELYLKSIKNYLSIV